MDIHCSSGLVQLPDPSPASGQGHILPAGEVRLVHNWGATTFYRHGWNSWSATRWWSLDRDPWRVWNNPERTLTAEDASTDTTELHRSHAMTMVQGPGDQVLLLGALGADVALIDVTSSELHAHSESDACRWYVHLGTEQEVLTGYVTALQAELGLTRRSEVLTPARHTGAIWSSWYSWFEDITEEVIAAEIEPAAALGYDVLQIDDGWEQAVGHWVANHKFGSGMESLAQRIGEAGLRPGLWLAPFIALADTPVVNDHPELFLQDEDGLVVAGHNWSQPYHALDLSLPEARDWAAQLIATAREWGFDYLKLDFIYAGAIAAPRRGSITGREAAYHEGVRALRRAAGQDCYLLGSGAPVLASLGVLDGIRVGPDTAPYWDNTERHRDPTGPGVLNAVRNSVARVWLSPLVDCDPDVALLRTRGSLLSPEVNALTADVARICGVISTSDPSDWLSDHEQALVRALTRDARQPPRVEQLDRWRWRIGDRVVDLNPWLNPTGRISDRLLVK